VAHFTKPEEEWQAFLTGDHPTLRRGRRFRALLPAEPRCKNCNGPFGAPGGWLMRLMGRGPWDKNPRFCTYCRNFITRLGVTGAEIELSFLFADVRGSTTMGERLSPAEFSALMNRFYSTASRVLIRNDAIVDKFVGDEVVALFIPAMAGAEHAQAAVRAARELVEATRDWLPVGAGVHTGIAFVGAVGSAGEMVDFTALGDAVNTTARLASSAGPGEILVSDGAASAARLETSGLERRRLVVRGRSASVGVHVVTVPVASGAGRAA
jgi:adenylate cyclase